MGDGTLASSKVVTGVKNIIVQDEHDNPVFVAIQQSDDHIFAFDSSDKDFEEVLETLGNGRKACKVMRDHD